jgi:integrase
VVSRLVGQEIIPFLIGRPSLRCVGGGGLFLYNNFRNRVWVRALRRLGLLPVTPRSAHYSIISTLQARGIEIGLVAKLAGHSNANVTLGHYTQAVRGGENAVAALERAYIA